MTNYMKSLYKKAYRKCRNQNIPFSHDNEEWSDDEINTIGESKIVKMIVSSCKYWQKAYYEDMEYLS